MYLLFLTAAAWSRVYPFIVKNDLVVLRGFEEKMAWGISYLPPTRDTFLFVTAVERPPSHIPRCKGRPQASIDQSILFLLTQRGSIFPNPKPAKELPNSATLSKVQER